MAIPAKTEAKPMPKFDPNYVLSDRHIYGFDPRFNTRLWLMSRHSLLQGSKFEGGKTAATIIEECCKKEDINQRFILATLEKEQSLISTAPTEHRLAYAMGFGCSDGKSNRNVYRGFTKQIAFGTKRLNEYEIQYHSKIGKPFRVDEPLTEKYGERFVTPVNMASLACYLYTPFVGDRDLGNLKAPYGALYLWHVWERYFGNPQA